MVFSVFSKTVLKNSFEGYQPNSLIPIFENLFLRTVFENIENTVLVFLENCYYFLNLVFYVSFVFFKTKKIWEPNLFFSMFSLILRTENSFSKTRTKPTILMFGSCFLKLFLRTVFENTENLILVFNENCSCYLNLVFYMFYMLFKTKKKLRTKHVLLVFHKYKLFSKTKTKRTLHSENNNDFHRTPFSVLYVFKNSSQKQF